MISISKLKELAKKVPLGDRGFQFNENLFKTSFNPYDTYQFVIGNILYSYETGNGPGVEEAEFIAACSPKNILALIEKIEKYEKALKWFSDEDNYMDKTYDVNAEVKWSYESKPIVEDGLEIARKALDI